MKPITPTAIALKASRYRSLFLAKCSIRHYLKPWNYTIVLGDDERFWVVTNREASILLRAGYELAIF